jgi:hypothetical protein
MPTSRQLELADTTLDAASLEGTIRDPLDSKVGPRKLTSLIAVSTSQELFQLHGGTFW